MSHDGLIGTFLTYKCLIFLCSSLDLLKVKCRQEIVGHMWANMMLKMTISVLITHQTEYDSIKWLHSNAIIPRREKQNCITDRQFIGFTHCLYTGQ